jgi:alpha-tubulin suppressor-like RCC1 family protein
VKSIAAGQEHVCVVLVDGGVRCWGNGEDGRLGHGDVANIGDDEAPASVGVVDVGAPASSISAGYNVTCAALEDGAVRCWGAGMYGGLGYGNTDNIGDDEAPVIAGDVKFL